MSNLSGSIGEGSDPGFGDKFVNTGYGTYAGTGNVDTRASEQSGTGYDEHGQVKTSFGKWNIHYDPVTGAATTNTTTGYKFPGSLVGGVIAPGDVGGLTDISASAPGHTSTVDREKPPPEKQKKTKK